MKRLNLVLVVSLVGVGLTAIGCGGGAPAEEAAAPAAAPTLPPPSLGEAAEGEERPRFIAPIRGIAELAYLKPDTEVVSGEVVTQITVQNRATGAIAGLKIDEYWWDADGNPLPGDSERLRQPLMPGEVAVIELRVPRNSRMNRNNYNFSHANGEIKATLVPELPDPEPVEEAEEADATDGEPT